MKAPWNHRFCSLPWPESRLITLTRLRNSIITRTIIISIWNSLAEILTRRSKKMFAHPQGKGRDSKITTQFKSWHRGVALKFLPHLPSNQLDRRAKTSKANLKRESKEPRQTNGTSQEIQTSRLSHQTNLIMKKNWSLLAPETSYGGNHQTRFLPWAWMEKWNFLSIPSRPFSKIRAQYHL